MNERDITAIAAEANLAQAIASEVDSILANADMVNSMKGAPVNHISVGLSQWLVKALPAQPDGSAQSQLVFIKKSRMAPLAYGVTVSNGQTALFSSRRVECGKEGRITVPSDSWIELDTPEKIEPLLPLVQTLNRRFDETNGRKDYQSAGHNLLSLVFPWRNR